MIAPRYEVRPPGRGRAVYLECVQLCEQAGLELDDWQAYALERILKTSGKAKRWAASEAGVVVPRQNGKGGILEALELSSLYSKLVRIPLTIHSAHQFDTSLEAFHRLVHLIEDTPAMFAQVATNKRGEPKITYSHGDEGIEMRDGRRIRFRTRTKGGGRGFSCGRLILDEAMVLAEMAFGALLPTLSAQPDPQVIYTGSAVDQLVHEHGVVLARLRKRALDGGPNLVYLEWAADAEIDELDRVIDDRAEWHKANPAMGIRIGEGFIETERAAMDSRTFGVERLGVADWPPVDAHDKSVLDLATWLALADPGSQLLEPVVLAFDVTPDRSRATISAAGRRPDGNFHVETADARPGTGWLPARLHELAVRWAPEAIVCDGASPASAILKPLEAFGIEPELLSAREYGEACGLFFDLVAQGHLRHLGSPELQAAVRNASKRPLGEAWAWSRRLSAGDISPLVAATIALWRAHASSESVYESRGLLAV